MKWFDKSIILKSLLLSIGICVILISFPFPTQAAVILRDFTATYSDGKVAFTWETASEQDSAGFMLNRSTSENGTYIQIPESDPVYFIALGEGGEYSAEYYNDEGDFVTFYDEDITEGMTYWYRLESLDNGNNSDYSDPVSVFIGATPTPTKTSTSSPQTDNTSYTPSPTSTQSDGATATKTSTSKPTKTKKPGTRTPIPTATRYTYTGSGSTSGTQAPTNNNPPPGDIQATAAAQTAEASQGTATVEVLPTATLVPLPSITIEFPTIVAKQPDELDANLLESAKAAKTNSDTWLTPQRLVIVVVIAGIWIMLGGWFYLSFKRLEK